MDVAVRVGEFVEPDWGGSRGSSDSSVSSLVNCEQPASNALPEPAAARNARREGVIVFPLLA
ncbi:hypothetical protein QA600_19040 [Natronococcus sp. A-GB1]|uniref:hypothetical protein n=1 Tax=Natronococcus sp. A-GB1 TaxID=3037648 RepID=UPI00241CECDB|nr:hypothetical protein [Natronococcus sp. A-GB1]MDG5761429.1 hypothetical protein [Natronococcus sp. A-GB1]